MIEPSGFIKPSEAKALGTSGCYVNVNDSAVIPAKAGTQRLALDSTAELNQYRCKERQHCKEHRMRERIPCVYIMASRRNGTLYIGVTSDLPSRVWQHKHDQVPGFTRRYRVHTLVWHEVHGTMESAIAREKALKEWKRAWKIALIEDGNPYWRDLHADFL